MSLLFDYTDKRMRRHLDNGKRTEFMDDRNGEDMSLNKTKIRRPIMMNGVKVWVSGNTEQEYAENLMKLFQRSNDEKKIVDQTKHNFKEYAENWYTVFSKPNVSYVTSLAYRNQLENHIYPTLADKNIEDITVVDIQQIFNGMSESSKQETKNKVKNVLNQIFKMAIEDDLVMKNPVQSGTLKIKGMPASVTIPYSIEEMQYMAAHLKDITNKYDRGWLALSLSLPLRCEEVLGLRWIDVEESEGIVHVRSTVTHPTRNDPYFKPYTKTDSSRRDLRISKEMLLYLPDQEEPGHYVIGGIKPLSYTQLRLMRKRIAKQIGFDDIITPRRFRTTVATDISASTHDLKLVQQMLGHSTPQMTLKHYDKGRSGAIDAADAIGKCYGFVKD